MADRTTSLGILGILGIVVVFLFLSFFFLSLSGTPRSFGHGCASCAGV